MYSKALIEFQQFMRINITRTFDENIRAFMNKPRRGMPDVYHRSDGKAITKRRLKRFILMGNKWLLNGDLTSKWKTSNLNISSLKDIELDSLNQTLIITKPNKM
jgi:hypothetical protein